MPYEFDRYINGVLMAEGVTIERQDNLPDAMREAARIASRGPNGEAPVLILRAEALSRTGAVKVKALDEDDYEEIISAAAINMRKAASGIRGQVITVQDSIDWWVMKETERRILSALEPAAPEGQQEAAEADRIRREMEEILRRQSERDIPFAPATRPAEQAVTEAMVEAAAIAISGGRKDLWDGFDLFKRASFRTRAMHTLKAAMEAGRHD